MISAYIICAFVLSGSAGGVLFTYVCFGQACIFFMKCICVCLICPGVYVCMCVCSVSSVHLCMYVRVRLSENSSKQMV